MTRYPYLLLDADDTLFDFGAANAIAFHAVCQEQDIPDTLESFALYEICNNALWQAFDRGEVAKDFLVVERFRRFLKEMGLQRDAEACNRIHLTALAQGHALLPHAEEVCRKLSQVCTLYIVTNAVADVQKSRLAASAVRPYIKDAFISEDAGASKPSAVPVSGVRVRPGCCSGWFCPAHGWRRSSQRWYSC
jgi:2-haloacid dehalogenase